VDLESPIRLPAASLPNRSLGGEVSTAMAPEKASQRWKIRG